MSTSALMLVIAAAILHAVWNLITKQVNGKLAFFWLISLFSAIIYLPVLIYQLIHTPIQYTGSLFLFSGISAVLHLFYFIALQLGYRKADLSVVYPIARGAGPIFTIIGAILIFQERPGIMAITGAILIVCGVILMTGLKLKKDSRMLAGINYGLLTGFLISSYTLWDRFAVVEHQVSAIFITFSSIALPLIILLPLPIRKADEVLLELKTHWKQGLAVAIFQPLSYLLILIAMKRMPLSYVAPLRELSIVFAVFFGANLLKEKDSKRRIIAALIILIGISLLAW
ncbi:DMT family transporter [Pedobacter caeni]|uniref:EamA-like transporter family protein n=1 Tax=Pedobacter caeni TaxID=288992 RepID=A0A1M4W0F0_9SPHI|nr:DMT family transporter [Pedobacter caeni]SHE74774.1 EamA-like transporter family protein [Pedobacter caeni]